MVSRCPMADPVNIRCPSCGEMFTPGTASRVVCPLCLLIGGAAAVKEAQAEASVVELPAGTVIDHYTLLQKIGVGGFGVVYRAEQSFPLQREVALKVLKSGVDTAEVVRRFEVERRALALMVHPNVATVFDAGTTPDGCPYFVMELVAGVPVSTYCDRCRLGIRERLALFVDICHAVQHAHQKGIIHCDLKPSNVLVTEHDGRAVPKVIDFGVAKAIDTGRGGNTLATVEGRSIGTPEYMSPEQVRNAGVEIDTRSDVYSLGVLLYELLTGTTPAESAIMRNASSTERERLICEVEPPKPSLRVSDSALIRHLRGDLDCVALKALEKHRDRRYETVNALRCDILRHLSDDPVSARSSTTSYRVHKFVRRNRPLVIGASAVLLALLAGIIGISAMFLRVRRQKLLTEIEVEERRKAQHVADIQLAAHLWDDPDGSARQIGDLLRSHIPEPGEPDLRDFEWHYLWHRLNNQSRVISIPGVKVQDIAISPDGTVVLLTDRHEIRCWDIESLNEVPSGNLRMPSGAELSALSGDGGSVAMVVEGALSVVDRKTGSVLAQLPYDPNVDRGVHFSRDGKIIVILGDRTRWYDVATGSELGALDATGASGSSDPVRWVGSSDGFTIAIGGSGESHHGIETYRLDADLAQVEQVTAIEEKVKRAFVTDDPKELSPRGDYLLSSNFYSGHIGIHAVQQPSDGRVQRLQRLFSSICTSLCFSPDSETVAAGGADGTIHLLGFDPGPDKQVWLSHERSLKGHLGSVERLTFSSDGGKLLSFGSEGELRIWNLEDPAPVPSYAEAQTDYAPRGVISPDGLLIVTSGDTTVEISEPSTGKILAEIKPPLGRTRGLAFSPDNETVALGHTSPPIVSIWNVGDRPRQVNAVNLEHVVRHLEDEPSQQIASLDYSPDGRLLAIGFGALHADNPGRTVQTPVAIWDLDANKLRTVLQGHTDYCLCVKFSLDGKWLATGSHDGTARIWNTATWQVSQVIKVPGDPDIEALDFSPDGRQLAIGARGAGLTVWDCETGVRTGSFVGHSNHVTAVAFSPGGRTLASAGYDGVVKLWNVESCRPMLELMRPGQRPVYCSLAFSQDGKQLLGSFRENTAIWSACPPWWQDSNRAIQLLGCLRDSGADFQSRISLINSAIPDLEPALKSFRAVRPADREVEAALLAVQRENCLRRGDFFAAEEFRQQLLEIHKELANAEPGNGNHRERLKGYTLAPPHLESRP